MNRIISDISDFIFVADTPQKSDALFLPGGSYPELPEYAAELFHKGYARYLVPSGGMKPKYNDNYSSECELFTDVLIKSGVSRDAIICENKARHTRDNAFLSREIVDEMGLEVKSAMIVCKAFHARRCLMLYQMAFPGVSFIVCPVHCYNITKENWFTTEKGIDRVLGELARCGSQFVSDIKSYLC